MMAQQGWRRARERWWRSIAACAIALTLGLGQAHAEMVSFHEGGQGRDKETSAVAPDMRSGGDGRTQASATAKAAASDTVVEQAAAPEPIVQVDDEDDGTGTTTRTRSSTRTFVKDGFVVSRTRSKSIAVDEEGNRAVARAVAKARAPNDAAAVENGAGRVVAKASVAVKGDGAASADAGGSIGISGGRVEVATWGKTSAEVF